MPNNYTYDKTGNLIGDVSESITRINWTVYGKIGSITKSGNTMSYGYDAGGNRITKTVSSTKEDYYVRDARGNALALYSYDNSSLTWAEQDLYGSSRLGMVTPGLTIQSSAPLANANYNPTGDPITNGTEGKRIYELTNHLGNVMVTISDRKTGVDEDSDGVIDYYKAEVLTAQDYYAFGMMIPGRTYSNAGAKYKYGFNGKENDNEVKGDGNQQDYGMRIYDPRLGRFLSVDPLTASYPWYTPYLFAGNKPISKLDLDGMEDIDYTFYFKTQNEGKVILTPPIATQVITNPKASFNITYKINIDGTTYIANSIETVNGRDDGKYGAGDFSRVQMLNRQDLVNIIGYSNFVVGRIYSGNLEAAQLTESNAGLFNNKQGLLDFKNSIYRIFGFNRDDLIAIDGTVYNANEAGNYIWSFILTLKGSLLDPEAVAEVGSLIQGRHDEPHEKKAIRAGALKALNFRLSKEDYEYAEDIFNRYKEDYEFYYEDPQNEDQLYKPANILGGLKTIREKEGQQPTLPKEPY